MKPASWSRTAFTFAKTAALLALIVIGLLVGLEARQRGAFSGLVEFVEERLESAERLQPGFTVVGGLALALLFGKAMVGPLFAQTAWTNVTFIGSEVRDPGRNLPRALLAGCRDWSSSSTFSPISLMSRLCRSRQSNTRRRIASRSL